MVQSNKLLCATKYKPGIYTVTTIKGKDLGTLEIDIDGYYKYYPILIPGYWDAEYLKAIVELLDDLNADWDAKVKKFMDNSKYFS